MTTLNYPGVPGTMLYGGRQKEAPPGPEGVDTNITLTNTSGAALETAPATFGFSFPPGAFDLAQNDLRASITGTEIPLQMDAVATHSDGTARYAVLSVAPGALASGEQKVVRLFTGNKKPAFAGTVAALSLNPLVELTVYGMQRTRVSVTNSTFVVGETVGVTLTRAGEVSTYQITVLESHKDSNGNIVRQRLSDALAASITAGAKFRARVEGRAANDGFMEIETMDGIDAAFTVDVNYAGSATITVTNISDYAPSALWTANAQSQLASQITASNAGTSSFKDRRLHGPVVTEFRQIVRFTNSASAEHPFLIAVFDIRLYADGRKWIDVSLENTSVMTAAPADIHYSAAFMAEGNVVATTPRFWHFSKTRWRKSLWIGAPCSVRVTRDMEYHMASRNSPRLSLDLGSTPAALDAKVANEVAKKNGPRSYLGPMNGTILTDHMGTTGGRPEIGLISDHVYEYYATQDDRAKYLMERVVDNAGCFASYYRDEDTGWPLGLDTRTNACISEATATIPKPSGVTPYDADGAHQGTFGYHPYLISGDQYYLDDMMFWTSRNLTVGNWGYRFTAGVGNLMDEQTRGMAWVGRAINELCFVMPDAHPRKAYYVAQRDANMENMRNRIGVSWAQYSMNAVVLDTGWGGLRADNWQCDFLMTLLGWLRENKVQHAKEIIEHLGVYQFGRVLEAEQGVCPKEATAYFAKFVKAEGGLVSNWIEYGAAVDSDTANGHVPGVPCANRSIVNHDYAAVLLAAMRICASEGDPLAIAGRAVWEPLAGEILATGYRKWKFITRN